MSRFIQVMITVSIDRQTSNEENRINETIEKFNLRQRISSLTVTLFSSMFTDLSMTF